MRRSCCCVTQPRFDDSALAFVQLPIMLFYLCSGSQGLRSVDWFPWAVLVPLRARQASMFCQYKACGYVQVKPAA